MNCVQLHGLAVQLMVMGGAGARRPQSVQSEPRAQSEETAPEPPSSHSPSAASKQVSPHKGVVEGGGNVAAWHSSRSAACSSSTAMLVARGPQSVQSEP